MKRCIVFLLLIMILAGGCVMGINTHVQNSAKNKILTEEQAMRLEDVDYILILGCKVRNDGSPSHMLNDRLSTGMKLYSMDGDTKLLMSGDDREVSNHEVKTMQQYALNEGAVPSDVILDAEGFSTYESVVRAKELFGAEKILIVTQEYHLYRAIYTAEALGLEAYGLPADERTYVGQIQREIREVLARVKDYALVKFK